MPCVSAPLTRKENVEYLYSKFLEWDYEVSKLDVQDVLDIELFRDESDGSYDPWYSEILCHLCAGIEKMEYKKNIITPKLRAWYNLHKLVDEAFNEKIENECSFRNDVISACKDYLRVVCDEL